MNDKEFQLQYDLGLARERVAQYVKTIGEQTSEIGRLQALSDEVLDLLAMMFDAYEDGPECYEDPEDCAGHLGKAVNLDEAAFDRIADILNKHRPRNAGEVTANVRVQGRCAALSRSVPWNEVLEVSFSLPERNQVNQNVASSNGPQGTKLEEPETSNDI